jgi:hypothetical protein
MQVRLNTRLESVSDDGVVRLSDGDQFASDTLVGTATKSNPLLAGPTSRSTAAAAWCARRRCR